jgi:hypothetical protein
MDKHPRVTRIPPAATLHNHFIFRTALCSHILALEWLAKGGAAQRGPAKVRNDIVDVNFAAYATYFDGFLTKDRLSESIYQQAKVVLELIS